MKVFREALLFLCLIFVTGLSAQEYGPVKVDLGGYINDRAGEISKVTKKPAEKKPSEEAPKKVEAADTSKSSDRPKATSSVVPETKTMDSTSTTESRDQNVEEESTGSSLILFIGVGVLVLIGVIVAFLLKKKKTSSPYNIRQDTTTLAEKIEANEQALMTETQMGRGSIQNSTGTIGGGSSVSQNSQDMADRFANETKVDERGQNPSGLIIDEDKYFDSGAQGFVDEDFDGKSS